MCQLPEKSDYIQDKLSDVPLHALDGIKIQMLALIESALQICKDNPQNLRSFKDEPALFSLISTQLLSDWTLPDDLKEQLRLIIIEMTKTEILKNRTEQTINSLAGVLDDVEVVDMDMIANLELLLSSPDQINAELAYMIAQGNPKILKVMRQICQPTNDFIDAFQKQLTRLSDTNFFYYSNVSHCYKYSEYKWLWQKMFYFIAPGAITKLRFQSIHFKLPPEIGNFVNLEILEIYGNWAIKTLPAEIGLLPKLKELNLRHSTNFSSLPPEIGNNKALEKIDLCATSLQSLPDELRTLPNLQYLDISKTKITKLSSEIINCKNLTELDLSKSKIEELPQEVCSLPKLKSLNLATKELKKVPHELADLTKNIVVDWMDRKLSVSIRRSWIVPSANKATNTRYESIDDIYPDTLIIVPNELQNDSIEVLNKFHDVDKKDMLVVENALSDQNTEPERAQYLKNILLKINKVRTLLIVPSSDSKISKFIELITDSNYLPDLKYVRIYSSKNSCGSLPKALARISRLKEVVYWWDKFTSFLDQ